MDQVDLNTHHSPEVQSKLLLREHYAKQNFELRAWLYSGKTFYLKTGACALLVGGSWLIVGPMGGIISGSVMLLNELNSIRNYRNRIRELAKLN